MGGAADERKGDEEFREPTGDRQKSPAPGDDVEKSHRRKDLKRREFGGGKGTERIGENERNVDEAGEQRNRGVGPPEPFGNSCRKSLEEACERRGAGKAGCGERQPSAVARRRHDGGLQNAFFRAFRRDGFAREEYQRRDQEFKDEHAEEEPPGACKLRCFNGDAGADGGDHEARERT